MGERALGRRPWGRNSTLFAIILNMFLSRNLDKVCLKMPILWEKKTVKIVSASPPLDPRVVISAFYYNFVELVSSAKCILFRSKKNQVTTANVLLLLLPHFCTYF